MNASHTLAICNECATSVIVQADGADFRCNCCEAVIINSVSPIASSLGVNVTAAAPNPAPGPDAAAVTTNSVSDGEFDRSLPRENPVKIGEIEPSVTLACAPSESNPGPSLATGMSRDRLTAGGFHEEHLTSSIISSALNVDLESGTSPGVCGPEREMVGATNSSSCGIAVNRRSEPIGPQASALRRSDELIGEVGLASCPHDSNSNPETSSLVPVDSAPLSNSEAAPLFLSSNTPEASGTARKAPSGSLLGEPSRISDRASLSLLVDPELDAVISELEADWFAKGISLADLTFPMLKNSTTFRVTQDSLIQAPASSDISNPSSFSVGA